MGTWSNLSWGMINSITLPDDVDDVVGGGHKGQSSSKTPPRSPKVMRPDISWKPGHHNCPGLRSKHPWPNRVHGALWGKVRRCKRFAYHSGDWFWDVCLFFPDKLSFVSTKSGFSILYICTLVCIYIYIHISGYSLDCIYLATYTSVMPTLPSGSTSTRVATRSSPPRRLCPEPHRPTPGWVGGAVAAVQAAKVHGVTPWPLENMEIHGKPPKFMEDEVDFFRLLLLLLLLLFLFLFLFLFLLLLFGVLEVL